MRILIAGCGYVGTRLGIELAVAGHEVAGLRRDPTGLPPEIRPVTADLTDPGSLTALPTELDAVVLAASPDAREAAAYRAAYRDGPENLLTFLANRGDPLRRVVLTTSTAVYGQRNGEWVNEESATEPTSRTGRILVRAEAAMAAAGWHATIVRLGGIYGPGRTRLLEQVRRGEATCPEHPVFTNRIHRDDCAGAIAHLLAVDDPEAVYCAVDHEPVERCALLRWLAEQLGAPQPRVGDGRTRGGSKRVRNDRLVASGYVFRYPTFREGYGALIDR